MALLNKWLTEEHQSGAPKPQQAVLATCAKDAIPHARVVAIREIDARCCHSYLSSCDKP